MGAPKVKFDPAMGSQGPSVAENCNASTNTGCICEDNKACIQLKRYISIPYYIWQVGKDVHFDPDPDQKGVY